jgi:hypothetical protein
VEAWDNQYQTTSSTLLPQASAQVAATTGALILYLSGAE